MFCDPFCSVISKIPCFRPFPGCLVVRNCCFNCQGLGLIPGQGSHKQPGTAQKERQRDFKFSCFFPVLKFYPNIIVYIVRPLYTSFQVLYVKLLFVKIIHLNKFTTVFYEFEESPGSLLIETGILSDPLNSCHFHRRKQISINTKITPWGLSQKPNEGQSLPDLSRLQSDRI